MVILICCFIIIATRCVGFNICSAWFLDIRISTCCPSDVQSRYKYIQRLKAGLKVPSVLLTYSPGNNKGNLHFIWQIDCTDSATETFFRKVCQ